MTTRQVDLNQLRNTVLANQRQGQTLPVPVGNKIFVDRNGNLVQGNAVRPEERRELSEVQQGVFAASDPEGGEAAADRTVIDVPFRVVAAEADPRTDLNRVRATILENQRRGAQAPMSRTKRIVVGRDAKIRVGDEADGNDERELSEVQQGVFAAVGRLAADRQTVADRFPWGTQELVVDGVTGWLYSLHDELGEPYTLFAYHDGSLYQVKVVSPEVEGRYSPHNGHLYSNGTICFGNQMGLPSLDQAYAKSVLWANGFSVFLRTGAFPFSLNNL